MSTPSLSTLCRAVEPSPLLRVSIDLDYPNKPGALRGVSFSIGPGEVLGLIGESGSGKSSVAMAVLGLLGHRGATVRGIVEFEGRNLVTCRESERRSLRGREIGLVLQSPLASLNPVLRIGTQLVEAWRAHRKTTPAETRARIFSVLEMVSLPATDQFLAQFPRQLSVGLAQRVLIAMAIIHSPKLLIADEPTSALDAITASEIRSLFERLNREMNTAILFISHDLLSVASLCHRVAIMRNGEIVESDSTSRIFEAPRDEFTRALVAALPRWPETIAGGPRAAAGTPAD
jgi:ABC-type dipeptide/oligopeptide/nickel transport system ATPase component